MGIALPRIGDTNGRKKETTNPDAARNRTAGRTASAISAAASGKTRRKICQRAETPLPRRFPAGRTIDKLFVADGDTDRALARICAMAKEAGAVVVPTDRRKLDFMSATGAHQGVIAMVAAHDYASIDDILKKRRTREKLLIVICDELSDPA